jgi:predicted 2-oxoglutarate/Fe(II)-dependent dioxygenase YbiX
MLIPTGYFVRQLQVGQELPPVLDVDNSPDAKVHDVYRKIALVSLSQDYEGGEHLFPELGQSVSLGAGDAIFYEISPETTTGISEVLAGEKIDLIYWYSELKLNVRFDDFEMQKMENLSDRF